MKKVKNVVLIANITIELMAIALFVFERIDPLAFFLIVMSQACVIGLYFYDRHKLNKH